MSKITKKQLHNGWHCHDTEIIKMKKELRELKQSVLRLEKLTDEKLLDEPQLKQLDQSVFNGLDEKWRFAAVGKNGSVYKFRFTPKVSGDSYLCDEGYHKYSLVGTGYDASNWQNSLIERDTAKEPAEVGLSSELTGSELCKAMLARGDKYVLCIVSPYRDAIDNGSVILPKVVTKFHEYGFITTGGKWAYAIPINNQGEPLTASEVGL